MPKKQYRIAPEVKADILRKIKEEGISVAQAASDHGVAEGTIYGWLGKGLEGAPTIADIIRLKRENKQLLELVGELTVKLSTAQKKS